MAVRTKDLSSRVEQAFVGLLTTVLTGVDVREFNDNDDDEDSQCAIKCEKDEEEIPGTGIWLLNVIIRLRNLTAAQVLTVENVLRDSNVVREDLATQGANEFLMPSGDQAVMLRGGWQRSGAGSDKTQTLSLGVTAQNYEHGLRYA